MIIGKVLSAYGKRYIKATRVVHEVYEEMEQYTGIG